MYSVKLNQFIFIGAIALISINCSESRVSSSLATTLNNAASASGGASPAGPSGPQSSSNPAPTPVINPQPTPIPSPAPTQGGGSSSSTRGPIAAKLLTPTLYVATNGSDSNSGRSSGSPFASIIKAAEVANSGDVVQVAAGTYNGNIQVHGSGTQSSPIVFQASNNVTIQGTIQPANWKGGSSFENVNPYVTWNGFTIQTSSPSSDTAVRLSTGWTLMNDTIQNTGLGADIRGNNVTIDHCLFQNIDGPQAHAFVGSGDFGNNPMVNTQVLNSIWQNINNKGQSNCGNSCVQKFGNSQGAIYDNDLAQNNNGPGIWFDTGNQDFVVRNCTLRSNVGLGLELEWNGGPSPGATKANSNGKVYNNDFFKNGSSAWGTQTGGIGLFETQGVEIYNNNFQENHFTSISLREGSHPQPLANNSIHDNYLNDPNAFWAGPRTAPASPLTNNNTMNHDTFGPGVTQLYIQWHSINASSLSQCHGVSEEQTGMLGTLPAGVGNGGTP